MIDAVARISVIGFDLGDLYTLGRRLFNQTIHQANENIPVKDLELLTRVYRRMLDDWFAEAGA